MLVALTVTLGAGGDEVVTDGAGLGGEELDGLAGGVDGVGVLTVGAGVGFWLGGGVLLPGWLLTLAATTPV